MHKIFLFSAAAFFILLSCKKSDAGPKMPATIDSTDTVDSTDTIQQPDDTLPLQKFYLALGDSYTIGESVDESERYPVQAVKLLNDGGLAFAPPEIIARTGWTTANLDFAISANPPAKTKYDIVTLLIGVNNQYQGRSTSEYKDQFALLLNKAIGFAGNRRDRVFVLSIPDYSVTPFASAADTAKISREIDEFNSICRNIAESNGVSWLNITDGTRLALTDRSLLADDGLHPSGKEYAKWAAKLAPMIRTVLK
jgi:lysophospholipase L1-like esterase